MKRHLVTQRRRPKQGVQIAGQVGLDGLNQRFFGKVLQDFGHFHVPYECVMRLPQLCGRFLCPNIHWYLAVFLDHERN